MNEYWSVPYPVKLLYGHAGRLVRLVARSAPDGVHTQVIKRYLRTSQLCGMGRTLEPTGC